MLAFLLVLVEEQEIFLVLKSLVEVQVNHLMQQALVVELESVLLLVLEEGLELEVEQHQALVEEQEKGQKHLALVEALEKDQQQQ